MKSLYRNMIATLVTFVVITFCINAKAQMSYVPSSYSSAAYNPLPPLLGHNYLCTLTANGYCGYLISGIQANCKYQESVGTTVTIIGKAWKNGILVDYNNQSVSAYGIMTSGLDYNDFSSVFPYTNTSTLIIGLSTSQTWSLTLDPLVNLLTMDVISNLADSWTISAHVYTEGVGYIDYSTDTTRTNYLALNGYSVYDLDILSFAKVTLIGPPKK